MTEIRNCSRTDLAAVAALFQKTFRNRAGPAPRSLEAYLAEAFLDHPAYDAEIASRVHVDDTGRVTGFIGVFPVQLEHRGRQLRGAVAGTLMVESPEREPLAGAKLLRSVVKGAQDIAISETTNLVSQRLWGPLGGKVVPLMSLDWFRVLRPGASAVALLSEKYPSGGALLAPAARAIDSLSAKWTARSINLAEPSPRLMSIREASDCEFATAVMELSRFFELRPRWSERMLEWLLRQAAPKARYGPVRQTIVRGRKGELVGCYLYHGEAGGIGRVLQFLARPSDTGEVLDNLLHEAHASSFAALRGRCSQQLMTALLTRNCIFLHRASTVIHTSDSELQRVVETGGALVTGLAGESWTRLVGDEFN